MLSDLGQKISMWEVDVFAFQETKLAPHAIGEVSEIASDNARTLAHGKPRHGVLGEWPLCLAADEHLRVQFGWFIHFPRCRCGFAYQKGTYAHIPICSEANAQTLLRAMWMPFGRAAHVVLF